MPHIFFIIENIENKDLSTEKKENIFHYIRESERGILNRIF